MKMIIIITAFLLVSSQGYAQFRDMDKFSEELLQPLSIDPALTNLASFEPQSSVQMPKLPELGALYKPPRGYSAAGAGILVTKQNQEQLGITIDVDAKYIYPIDPEIESIRFQVFVPKSGATTNLCDAILFLSSTNSPYYGQNTPMRSRFSRISIPLDTRTIATKNDKLVSVLTFTISKQLTEIIYLRLDCTRFGSTGEWSTGVRLGKVYALRLKDYIPEKPNVELHHNDGPVKEKPINIKVKI